MNGHAPETDIPMLDLELVRGCTLRCRWCAVAKDRAPRFMDLGLFERLAAEALAHRIGRRRFSIFLGGEPLLHPGFGEALRILRRAGYREAGYRKIQAFTNGMALNGDRAREIVETGVLTRLSISVDGIGDEASFAYMRPPATLPVLVKNVAALMERRAEAGSPLEVVVSSIIPRPAQVPFPVPPIEEIERAFRRIFEPLGISSFEHRILRDEYNTPGWRMPRVRNPHRPCFLAKDRKLVVLYNGDVAVCSRRLNGESTITEVRTTTLLDAWNDPELRRIRAARIAGDFEYRADLCRECDCGPFEAAQ